MAARIKPFYVYSILDSENKVIYIGKGINSRVKQSLRERKGSSYKIEKTFEHESDAFSHEAYLISKHTNLLNSNKGGFGGSVHKGTKEERLMKDIGTRAYAARMLLKYYLSFKYLSSKVDALYSKELTDTFNAFNVKKLREVAYG